MDSPNVYNDNLLLKLAIAVVQGDKADVIHSAEQEEIVAGTIKGILLAVDGAAVVSNHLCSLVLEFTEKNGPAIKSLLDEVTRVAQTPEFVQAMHAIKENLDNASSPIYVDPPYIKN